MTVMILETVVHNSPTNAVIISDAIFLYYFLAAKIALMLTFPIQLTKTLINTFQKNKKILKSLVFLENLFTFAEN